MNNNLYCDYIDAFNSFSVEDYVDNKIIINNSSNITTSNIILNNSSRLDKVIYFNNNNDLSINNSNLLKDIYFTTSGNYCEDKTKFGTKIDFTGKLLVYHNYSILQPTFAAGYYDVENEILQLKADGVNTDAQLTGIEANALYVQDQITILNGALLSTETRTYALSEALFQATDFNNFQNLAGATNFVQAQERFTSLIGGLANNTQRAYQNAIIYGGLGSVGIGLAGVGIAAAVSAYQYQQASNALINNDNITNAEKTTIYSCNIINEVNNFSNYNLATSNLGIFNGFINSNIINQQFIPKLKCNEITLNNKAITKFSLESLDNWIKTTHGWYWDATNGNLGINGTPNIYDFLIVGGQTTIQGDIITDTKFRNNSVNLALPATGVSGGNGDKLILKSGVLGIYPYSLGVNTNSQWYSVPPNANHTFYIGGNSYASITSSGLSVTGIINASTNLQENGTNLSAKYDKILYFAHPLLRDGNNNITFDTSVFYSASQCDLRFLRLDGSNSMTGKLNGTTINASSNLQENSVNLSAKYLKLDGTNNMTGKIAINNTGLAVPSTGIYGSAVGERIIFELGGILDHPYAIGRFTNQLWYSIPSSASHNFYCGGINRFIINSNGNVGIRTNPSIYNLDIFSGGASAEGIKIHNGTSQGFLALSAGISGNPGFINFHRANGNRVGYIGYTNLANYLDMTNEDTYLGYRITGNLLVNERTCLGTSTPLSANTKLTISGTSTGFSQPLVDIKQLGAWDGNYALQVSGYTNLYGIRINGNDTFNTIFQTLANSDIGITQNGANTSGGNINLSVYGAGGNIKFFTNSTNERMRINSSGNVGINSTDPRCKLDVNGIANIHNGSPFASTKMSAGSLTIGGQDFNYGGQFFSLGNWTGTNTAGLLMECANDTEIVIHDAGTRLASFMYYQGGSYNRFTMGRNMGWTGGASIFHFAGSVGINNPTPISSGILTFLSVGNAGSTNSDGTICIGRNTGGGATRQYRIGYTDDYSWCIGDYGGNNIAGTWIQQFYCAYSAPVASLFINAAGYVNMQYGYGNGSDIKIKTDIRTIDNALWKVRQLRGVYYTHITEGIKNIGLIAQEVEGIIPEVIFYDETNDIKCISYQNLVGLLINAIKEQQEIIESQGNQIKNIMEILSRNNIK